MFLTKEQTESGLVPEGTGLIFDVRMSIAGQNKPETDYTFWYEIRQGEKLWFESKGSYVKSNFHKVSLNVLCRILMDCLKLATPDKRVFVRLDTPAWNVYDAISRGSWKNWRRMTQTDVIYNRGSNQIKNQYSWNVLMFLQEFVSLSLIETDKSSEWYKELHEKNRQYFDEVFQPDRKKQPEELRKPKGITQLDFLERKKSRAKVTEAGKRRSQTVKKLRELKKLQ